MQIFTKKIIINGVPMGFTNEEDYNHVKQTLIKDNIPFEEVEMSEADVYKALLMAVAKGYISFTQEGE